MKSIALLLASFFAIFFANAQKPAPGKPFFIAQFAYNKFQQAKGTIGGTASLGIRFKRTFGVAVHTQLITFDGADNAYIPLALQFSFLPEKQRIAPYFHAGLGHGFYKQVISRNAFIYGNTFITAGAGVLFGSKKGGGVLLTVSYVNSGFKYSSQASTGRLLSSAEGVQLGVGFKF